jgi:hypothetical protein
VHLARTRSEKIGHTGASTCTCTIGATAHVTIWPRKLQSGLVTGYAIRFTDFLCYDLLVDDDRALTSAGEAGVGACASTKSIGGHRQKGG